MKVKSIYGIAVMLLSAACLPALSPANHNSTGVALASSATPSLAAAASDTATVSTTPLKASASATQATPGNVSTITPLASSAAISTHIYLPSVTQTPPVINQAIVADHTVIARFASIPQTAINSATSLKTLFMHQSTGGYIDNDGLKCLAGLHGDPAYFPAECVTYANNRTSGAGLWYDNSSFNWKAWDTPMADAIAKTDQFVDVVHAQAGTYQVIGMKYCYTDGWNQNENVKQNYYINKMLALESQYPGKVFIWSTSATWAEPGNACNNLFNSCQNIYEFNQQVRAYAKAHNKPLYDIADIESHDPNGNPCTVNGYEGMCAAWYDSGGGHPNKAGAIRLAKGFWWLMARLGGWNGNY